MISIFHNGENTPDPNDKNELYEWLENITVLFIAVALAIFLVKHL